MANSAFFRLEDGLEEVDAPFCTFLFVASKNEKRRRRRRKGGEKPNRPLRVLFLFHKATSPVLQKKKMRCEEQQQQQQQHLCLIRDYAAVLLGPYSASTVSLFFLFLTFPSVSLEKQPQFALFFFFFS